MRHKQPIVQDFARAFYDLEPAPIGGYEASFDDEPRRVRQDCYDRAQAAISAMRGEH